MSDEVRLAGDRDVRATIDTPDADAAVVACPPHPQMGGDRTDPRLRALGAALGEREIACLRFDYGPWDEGEGERRDARTVLAHARGRYDRLGLFGYSFGAGVALLVGDETDLGGCSVLAPPAALGGVETTTALGDADWPVQVVYGERDDTVDWRPVVERARGLDYRVEGIGSDHFFVGRADTVAALVADFFAEVL